MHFKKEPCRNFQRGSCQYGERCKFLHVTQLQSKPNVFGFGSQTGSSFQQKSLQQQKPNPFGFGVQNSSQSNSASGSGSRQNQFKPFENKWTRDHAQAANHKCTEPESCKREIVEDFEHERPLWKLTCYSHLKNGPCDIVGDISYEELRAAAYDDAKGGSSLQSIVEKERSLLNAKLIEFDHLLQNPYKIPSVSTFTPGSPVPLASVNALSPQNSATFSVSSFSQYGSSLNMGFGASSLAPLNNAFGQSNPLSISSQTSGPFGRQLPAQTHESSAAFNKVSFVNNVTSAESSRFPPSAMLPQTPISASNQLPMVPKASDSSLSGVGQATINANLVGNTTQRGHVSGNANIWLKEKWSPGEIPEEAPPDAFV